jgi:hypothetical protein
MAAAASAFGAKSRAVCYRVHGTIAGSSRETRSFAVGRVVWILRFAAPAMTAEMRSSRALSNCKVRARSKTKPLDRQSCACEPGRGRS